MFEKWNGSGNRDREIKKEKKFEKKENRMSWIGAERMNQREYVDRQK